MENSKKSWKKSFPSWREKPFFELITTSFIFVVILSICLISIYLTNTPQTVGSDLINFFIWFSVTVAIAIILNIYILYIKKRNKVKSKKLKNNYK
ncbi:hypothetical protein [[Mycoplasma] mobile]|uniref:Uncharacterized protein n=1 Tax=Mycoplasma mobile (strain ATCC 43663 / 163K / NCTC 11711) TaxID=267748 RepID=Q6KHH4_MYCM1|nr:hypothetical protein [[Mycoplasma] mobile]AAT27956.1 hypothetical protein MMOB4700 [Mycoplasma mobile 163K]